MDPVDSAQGSRSGDLGAVPAGFSPKPAAAAVHMPKGGEVCNDRAADLLNHRVPAFVTAQRAARLGIRHSQPNRPARPC